jgi:hypothetical protein
MCMEGARSQKTSLSSRGQFFIFFVFDAHPHSPTAAAASDIENKIRVDLLVDVAVTTASECRSKRRRQPLSTAPEISVFVHDESGGHV